jgi:hypothetical protein
MKKDKRKQKIGRMKYFSLLHQNFSRISNRDKDKTQRKMQQHWTTSQDMRKFEKDK